MNQEEVALVREVIKPDTKPISAHYQVPQTPSKHQRFELFRTQLAKKLFEIADSEPEAMFIINGEKQIAKPVVTDAGQALADDMGAPVGEEELYYLQPPNRQYFRRAFKEQEKQERNAGRKEFLATIVPRVNPNPTRLPTHLIHKIFEKNKMSIRWKQHRIGMVGTQCTHLTPGVDSVTQCGKHTTVFSKPLLWKIVGRRGKLRSVRHEMEYASRVLNRAA